MKTTTNFPASDATYCSLPSSSGISSDSMLALMDKHALPHPYWYAPRVMLYRGDCEEIAPMLRKVTDALISDPPYGINHNPKTASRGGGLNGGNPESGGFVKIHGDDAHFNPDPWMNYPIIVLWGANHYANRLPNSPRWFGWDKHLTEMKGLSFSPLEMAWTNSHGRKTEMFRHYWHGALRAGDGNGKKHLHPTEKPIELMAWCMEKAKVPEGGLVLDPYMGSGSTGIAALRTGRRFIGIEKDPIHFKTALERIQKELSQTTLNL